MSLHQAWAGLDQEQKEGKAEDGRMLRKDKDESRKGVQGLIAQSVIERQ